MYAAKRFKNDSRSMCINLINIYLQLEMIIDDYPSDIEQIIFIHSARDIQFWKGHYGMKMAGAVVKLLLDKPRL